MLWINLTLEERNTLEHLDGIYSGLPQLIEMEPGKPVLVNGKPRPDLPIPDARSIQRMYSCLERSGEIFELLEKSGDHVRAKPKPFEERGLRA
jgi:hypothetical protein